MGEEMTFTEMFSIPISKLSEYLCDHYRFLDDFSSGLIGMSTKDAIRKVLGIKGLCVGGISKKNNLPKVTRVHISKRLAGSSDSLFVVNINIEFGDFEYIELVIDGRGQLQPWFMYSPSYRVKESEGVPGVFAMLDFNKSLNDCIEDARGSICDPV